MICHDLSWFIMIYHDLQWFTMIYHDLPINLMVMFQFANAWVDELPPQLWTLGIREPGFSTCIFMGDPPPKKVSILYKMVSWMCLGLDLGIPLSIFWYILFWVSILEVSAIFTWQSAVRDVSRRFAAHLEQRGSNMDSAASVKCAFSVAFSC